MTVDDLPPTLDKTLPLVDPRSHSLPESYGAGKPGSGERYVRIAMFAQGGMGRIWMARDTNLDRDVALKELHPERNENPLALARFIREALITGQLEHPGIVPVYELAYPDDEHPPYYIMRFVKGRTLAQ